MKTEFVENDPTVEITSITPIQQMISSCTGAIITSCIVTPLDVVKIRLQAQQQPIKQGSCFIYHNGLMDCLCMCSQCTDTNGKPTKTVLKPWYAKPSAFNGTMSCELHGCGVGYKLTADSACSVSASLARPSLQLNGTLDAFVKIARNEGLSSLWSGLPPTLIMSIPATVFYFTTYDRLKYMMGYRDHDPSVQYAPILAGSISRVGTVFLISPLELFRTKMQSEQLSYRDLGQAVRMSLQHGGVRSLWRGVGPTLLRDVPFSSLYWFGYEYVKSLQLQLQGNEQVTFSQSFVAGAASGSFAALLTLPFDVVKTQRQIQLGQSLFMKDTKSVSSYTLISQIYRQQGISGLFAGLVPRLSKVAPACAIMISSYEYFKAFFKRRNTEKAYGTLKEWS